MYRNLRLRQFRSYVDFTTDLNHGVTIIVGPNGSGKTNILEALYVLSVGNSFRAADRDLVQHASNWFTVEGLWSDQKRSLAYKLQEDGKVHKQFDFDGAKKLRLTSKHILPVVLFEPDHLRLLRGSPSSRRDYLDSLLSKLQPDFLRHHRQYGRVLQQRNAILKRPLSYQQREDQLFAWDVRLAELAQYIVTHRLRLIERLNQRISDVYSQIANTPSVLRVDYLSHIPFNDYQAQLLRQLQANVTRDVERGFTTVGPHRDDFLALLSGSPVASSASRGETRSLLLALKIIELELLTTQDKTPLLLLDDVFSELDTARSHALAQTANAYQTVITTTDKDNITRYLDDFATIKTPIRG